MPKQLPRESCKSLPDVIIYIYLYMRICNKTKLKIVVTLFQFIITLHARAVAKYCDEYICV